MKGALEMTYSSFIRQWRSAMPLMSDDAIKYHLQKENMSYEWAERKDREMLKNEIIDEVMNRIQVEIINQAQKPIEEIGKQIGDILNR